MLSIEMVSRFCRLIHHFDATAAAYVVVALLGGRTFSTRPAKLILTECTRHVVAAAVFFDARPAHRTEWHVTSILLSPAFQLSTHSFLASHLLTVPDIAALEAHLSGTFRTLELHVFLVFRTYMRITARFWTKSDQRVTFKRFCFLEPFIFAEELIWERGL